jgi:3-dehydroquinate synthase
MKRYVFSPSVDVKSSTVYCGDDVLDRLFTGSFLDQYTAIFAVVDQRVSELFAGNLLSGVLDKTPVYLFPRGERHKTMRQAQRIHEWLWQHQVDRKCLLLGIGGGVVTDIAGFVTSTHKRGIAYVPIPTTLLAQVDAAIGGKTAVNLRGIKNVVGTFQPPAMVVCDSRFLVSLRPAQVREGLVEAFKVFAVRDQSTFEKHSSNLPRLLRGDGLNNVIADAIAVKLAVVNADPHEQGLRRVLNFGHTAGHALESSAGWSHGKSVALGMMVALVLSKKQVSLSQRDFVKVWDAITTIYHSRWTNIPEAARLWECILHDKKRTGSQVNFVLMPRCGAHRIVPVTFGQFEQALLETERILR